MYDIKHDFLVGVPCSKLAKFIEENDTIIATREDEALGMAIGAKLMGKNPLVFMQDSGLGSCLTLITSVMTPYDINIDFFISIRKKPPYHAVMGNIARQLLELVGIKKYSFIEEPE